MHGSKQSLPVALEGACIVSRQAEWGDLNVALEAALAGTDMATLLRGLPDNRCPCPHWGYVIRGRMVIQYRDRTETLSTGDAYYLTPGHLTIFEEDTEHVEFTPRAAYQAAYDVMAANLIAFETGTGGTVASSDIGSGAATRPHSDLTVDTPLEG